MSDPFDNRNDPVDRAIVSIGTALIGAIIAFGVAYLLGQRNKQIKPQTELLYPRTLEYDDSADIPARPTLNGQTEIKAIQLRKNLGIALAITGILIGFILFVQRNPFPGLLCAGVSCLLIWGFLRMQWFEQARENYENYMPPRKRPIDIEDIQAFTVILPKTCEWTPETAREFVNQMIVKLGQSVTFQIEATYNRVVWRILDFRYQLDPSVIMQSIRSFYPDAEIQVSHLTPEPFEKPFYRMSMGITDVATLPFPIKTIHDLRKTDPLVNLTHEMATLNEGERIVYSLTVTSDAAYLYDQIENLLSVAENKNPLALLTYKGISEKAYELGSGVKQDERIELYPREVRAAMEDKLDEFIYQCVMMIQIDAPTAERVENLTHIHTQLRQFDFMPLNALFWNREILGSSPEYIDSDFQSQQTDTFAYLSRFVANQDQRWEQLRLILTATEIATLWHLPHQGFTASNIVWTRGKKVKMQAAVGNAEGILIGVNEHASGSQKVYMLDQDRSTPTLIVGKPNVGKSNLMHQMIHQDIAKGRSVVVIDPHGTLVRDILERSIPLNREDDVVLLDLADLAHPPPLNPLHGLEGSVAIGRTVDIFDKLYPELQGMPQTMDALENALSALQNVSNATLWDIELLFRNEEYRYKVLQTVSDPVARAFWEDEYALFKEPQQRQISAPLLRRVRGFYRNESLRAILCHPRGTEFGRLVQQKKIILLSLRAPEDVIPESEQNLIGSLVISRLQLAALSGAFMNEPCYCYIDELQNYATSAIDKVFSEARKFKLLLTVAHQYLRQVSGPTLDAAMGTVGTMVVMQLGIDDAKTLSSYLKPSFDAQDIVNLDLYHAAVWMRREGKTEGAFSLSTLPPIQRPADAEDRSARIRSQSIESHTPETREQVLDWLTERYHARPADKDETVDDDPFSEPVG